MDHSYPIYTDTVECQDCYKCVRECPAKAIRVKDGHASILSEFCSACGHCVDICPVKAKKVRNDLQRAQHLVERKNKVYASLAPSWKADFPDVQPQQLIAAIKKLGFADVSETAIGAQEVSTGLIEILNNSNNGIYISSACPSIVEYICKNMQQYYDRITNVLSPLLVHSGILRKHFGEDISVVFFGPCAAKKLEADRNSSMLDLALTFSDLKYWLAAKNIDINEIETKDMTFVPYAAEEGRLYPIDGGMLETMMYGLSNKQFETISVSGLEHLHYYLDSFESTAPDRKIFIEALACKGGCINGPCRTSKTSGLNDRIQIRKNAGIISYDKIPHRQNEVNLGGKLPAITKKHEQTFTTAQIKAALAKLGKESVKEELNCGGCGYNTCRSFAEALLNKKAEASMCVSLMRKKALNKANALLRCIPSAVVIVDSSLRIIECNRHFAAMFGKETLELYDILPSLEGAYLNKILPFTNLFNLALRTGEDIYRENLRAGDKLLHISLFTIEPDEIIGGIIQDATEVDMHREAIANKANEVLRKNLNTVQGIAKLLGEHMADTEILLRSIAKGFASNNEEQPVEIKSKDNEK